MPRLDSLVKRSEAMNRIKKYFADGVDKIRTEALLQRASELLDANKEDLETPPILQD